MNNRNRDLLNGIIEMFSENYKSNIKIRDEFYRKIINEKSSIENKEDEIEKLKDFLYNKNLELFRIASFKRNMEVLIEKISKQTYKCHFNESGEILEILFGKEKNNEEITEEDMETMFSIVTLNLNNMEKIGFRMFVNEEVIETGEDGEKKELKKSLMAEFNKNIFTEKLKNINNIKGIKTGYELENIINDELLISKEIIMKLENAYEFFDGLINEEKNILTEANSGSGVTADLVEQMKLETLKTDMGLNFKSFHLLMSSISDGYWKSILNSHLLAKANSIVKDDEYNVFAEYILNNQNINITGVISLLKKADIEVYENNTNKLGRYKIRDVTSVLSADELSEQMINLIKYSHDEQVPAEERKEIVHNYIYKESLIQLTTGLTNSIINILKTPFLEFWREINENNERFVGVKITTLNIKEVNSTEALKFVKIILNTENVNDLNIREAEKYMREIKLVSKMDNDDSNKQKKPRGKI